MTEAYTTIKIPYAVLYDAVEAEQKRLMLARHQCIYAGDYEQAERLWHQEQALKNNTGNSSPNI